MYFGALSIGADLAGGLLAMKAFDKKPIHFLFKEVHGQFLKRCESDAVFHCQQGGIIAEAVQKTVATGERIHIPLHIMVYAPDTLDSEPCAKFDLTLSIKSKTN